MMEDEERQRKLQAGKAKLAEYRQKKAQADGQKKQKKKKKKPEVEVEEAVRDEEGGQPAEEQRGAPNTVFTLNKSLRSGETVTHDQTYTIEPESEVSTTAEDCSSEVNGFLEKTEAELESSMIREEDLNQPEPHMEPELQSGGPQSRMQIMEDELAAKNIAVEELSRELEEIRAAIGTEGVQQLQDFEEALKQRDEIITQLTANLQQARTEKEEVMREFLELTEQSQKLQIQFQQLQAGEILRSSNISSTAADLLQTRQQLTLHQQQLDEKDAEVKGHQQKAEEHLSVISELQERLNEAERVRTKAEESFTQSLREKDQLNNEHQRLISEHLQSAAQLQDQLLTSQQHLEDVKKHLAVKSEELERSERELSASRQKERMSSGEILQLMKTVEDLQRRCHQGSQSESEMVQRLEEDWSRRLERLRAELDELHGQQIVEMKQELRLQHAAEVERIGAQHAADMEKILQQHQSELERVKGHLSDSSGEVNVLNVKLVDFQKKLQETQVLRERAEQEVVHMSEEKLTLVRQAERLQQELQNTRVEIELRAQSPERSQMEMRLLHDEINDLQMQLAAAQQATGELEAKHESEITNYKIKLEMLEREKNAVLDTLAESQEAELERLRTDLLFSHEEELVKLRDDLQRENQLNLENLRDEMNTRHREATERLRVNYEDQLRATKGERTALAEERDALKHDHALERSRTEELISQLREMQTEVEDLRRRTEEETEVKDTKSENQSLKETNTVMSEELKSLIEERQHLLQNIDDLSTDNQQIHQQVKDLQDKIEKQTNTFSFAEKNFEVNYQELKEEYRCLVNTKIQLEERITKETMEYEAKLHDLQIMLETLQRRTHTKPSTDKMEDEEREMEKDTTELMEKLETAEREKRRLEEKLSETVSTVTLMESDAKQLEEDLKMVRRERDEIVRRNKELETQRRTDEERGGAEEKHDLHVRSLTEEEEEALHTSLLSVVEERSSDQQLRVLTQKKHAPLERPALSESVDGGPSPHTAEREEGRERETDQSTTDRRLLTHTRAAASEERLPQPDGRRALQLQENTGEVLADGVNIRTQCMMHRQEMNGSEHDECRLRLEAQRISLSQIHAAQLELLRESLLEQTQAELRSQEQHLRDAHARELRCMQEEVQRERQGVRGHAAGSSGSFGPSQVCRFIDDVSEECRQIIQSFSVVLGEEVVDLQRSESSEITDQTLLNLNTTDLTALIHHARELYGGLKQMLDGVLSAHRRLMDLQHSLKRERQMETSEQQILSGEQEIRSVCPPLDSSDLVPSAVSQELQEGSAHLQESHRREIEELKIFYQRQLEEMEKSLSAEILLLKEKLQELTETEQTCSVSSISQTLMRPQRCDTLQDDDDEEGLALRELQGVRDADERERSDLQQEKHHQELLQEEIAKVIVQMSVEFAQQTEIARINKQARETTTAAQTHSTEDEEEMKRDEQLKETSEEERLRADSQRETELQQMHEREQERERERDEHAYPSMQSSSTQTKQKKDEEEEEDEVTKGGGHKRAEVTSAEDPELTSEATTRITAERDLLRESNERLRLVLLDVLKTTAAVEETIGRHVEGILEASSKSPLRTTRRNIPADEFKPHSRLTAEPAGVPHTDASTDGLHGSETGTDDVSVFSAETETDEGLEMSRRTQGVELQIQEAELELEREECLMGISSRLQSAVEKLLITITETTGQLEHAHITQTELMKEKFRHNEEMEELLHRQEELQERLCEEATAREQLALELHKAEGLIDGYTGERLALEQQLRSRAELQLHLEQELHVTSSRLQELEHERLQILQERELLSRQQDAMRDGAGARELRLVDAALDAAPEADLLEETEKLMAEKVEVQRQAQKESSELQWQVKQLEAELEEQMTRLQELQEVKRMEEADLTQQIQALEKQLEHNRKFMDEQAADREHERDVFQQEIYNLEHQLKSLPKTLTGNEHRDRELEELTRVLQDKSDWCSDLLLRSEQLQREVEERDEELERVTARVRELEHTLLNRAAVEEVQHVCMAGRGDVTLEAQLQTEREALDRKEKEIVNLEEQLEQFREELENKSEEVNQLHMQLEIQRKEISSQQEVLQNQTRLTQVLEEKDREIKVLREQSAKHQRTGTHADTQVLEERDEVVRELESQVEHLQSEQERLKRNSEEEVDQLNAVIEKLQQELSNIEHKQSEEEELAVGREEYEEMKLKADTLTADNCALLSRCESLEREASTSRRLQEELQEKTAALVVVQAQVQALEQSAGLKVTCLSERVEELQVCVQEKDSELQVCRLNVQQAQSDADALHLKISLLEEKLREKVAAVLVSQAQLGAVQVQTKELHAEALSDEAEVSVETETLRCSESSSAPTQKLSALTEKLQELEESLNGMQKDQELQKHLLCSSEDELQEYETRLAVLMDLLNQMRTKPAQNTPAPSAEVSADDSLSASQLLQELQEVKGQAAIAQKELNCNRELNHKLREEIEIKENTIDQLQTALSQVSASACEEDSAATAGLLHELQEVKSQVATTKEELDRMREQSVMLQDAVQEREMSIALLKDQLHTVTREGEQSVSQLLQELQEVKGQAESTKEELNSQRERGLKLQEEMEVRDLSISQLKEKLQELQDAFAQTSDEPAAQSKKKGGKHGDSKKHHGKNKSADTSEDTSHKNSSDQSERTGSSSSSLNRAPSSSRAEAGTQTDLSQEEDVEEMIAGYSEKIGQMQELHAAEILDMEARHISESESLKNINHQLQDECRALRDTINKLRTSEGPSVRSDQPSPTPFRDEYTSDSGSDWSQRTGCDVSHPQQEFRTTPEGSRRDPEPDLLPDRIKTLLREVHQEGMQVLSLSELDTSTHIPPHTWSKERDSLINTVESLKSLISKLQSSSDTQAGLDWRAELLSAVQQVFFEEREVLKSLLYSHLERMDTADAVVHLSGLERALAEQESRHGELMAVLCSADRRSLLTEIRQLRDQLDTAGLGSERERDLVSGGSGSDRLLLEKLKTELAQTKLELENNLNTHHKHLKELDTLRLEVSQKVADIDSLNDRLVHEQKNVRELQWTLEKERCKSDRQEEREREEVEDLKLTLDEQRAHVAELSLSLETERQISAQLREQVQEVGVSSELQVQLDSQRSRADELRNALEREKELNTQLIQKLQTGRTAASPQQGSETLDSLLEADATCSQVEAGVLSVESLLQTLQTQLLEKQRQVERLMEEVERQKLMAVQNQREREEEKSALIRSAAQDQSALQTTRDGLQRRTHELQSQLDAETQTVQQLERERDRLQERATQLEERVRQLEATGSVGQQADRTRDWVLQQKTAESSSMSLCDAQHTQTTSDPTHMNNIINRLQLIAAKINSLTRETSDNMSMEGPDRESLVWLHSNVQDVMSLLQHIPSAPSAVPESAALLVGGSSSLLNECLLRQNAELTGFVSRLTEEKSDLRNQLLKLEEELRRYRQKHISSDHVSSRSGSDHQDLVLFCSERESWAQERSRLEKSLRQAEAELTRLRGEIRSDALRELTGPDADNAALKRMYGKYLRAESFRKALIYQKKYLLLLLGGFQECEDATLSLIARMGGRPTHACLESLTHHRRGFTRFRSAVRVSIALSRMRFLVKRWQKAAGGGSSSSPILNRNGLAQITGADVRNESSYLQPGSVEVYRERRATSRGRTGRESPRSSASVQHRYHSVAVDSGGLPCSHLQNYDPDRALTDYITRLEALQRRLGSVQSGSTSYAQMHFGMRR